MQWICLSLVVAIYALSEQEVLALVALAPLGNASGWVAEDAQFACQKWHGVTCENYSVVEIFLQPANISSRDSTPFQLPSEISYLENLRYLNLRRLHIEGTLPSFVGLLTKLTKLLLDGNRLEGTIPSQLGLLANLEELGFAPNLFEGDIPPQLGNLLKLKVLDLGPNSLIGTIPPQLARLEALEDLSLEKNQLRGSIPTQLGSLKSLQKFHLYSNSISGTIPRQLGNLTELKELRVSENLLSGPIPDQLGRLQQLELLMLSSNHLTGSLPGDLGKCINLTNLWADNNKLDGSLPSQFANLKNLQFLKLNTNNISGTLPAFLQQLKKLEWICLEDNELSGTIPSLLGAMDLRVLQLFWNNFTGTIPPQIFNLTRLEHLDLDFNHLTGTIPCEVSRATTLEWLALDRNYLTGTIPTQLGLLPSLGVLLLFENKLTGPVPTEIGRLTQLTWLDLRVNKLNSFENASRVLRNCSKLEKFDLSFNNLEGIFRLRQHPSLKYLDVSMNNLTKLEVEENPKLERIQAQFNALHTVDIFHNLNLTRVFLQSNLLTALPSFLKGKSHRHSDSQVDELQPLVTVTLASNKIEGPLPSNWPFNPFLMNLDLSRNKIQGPGAIISFRSTPLNQPQTEQDCRPEFVTQDPNRRTINMVGNHLNKTLLKIIELGPEFPAICRRGNLDREGWSSIFPQACPSTGFYLSADLFCHPCYTDWDYTLSDLEGWAETLADLLPKNDSFHEQTYATCSRCAGGFRKRTRTLNANQECENTEDRTQFEACSFPCKINYNNTNKTVPVKDQMEHMSAELNKNISFWDEPTVTFLPALISALTKNTPQEDVSIVVSKTLEVSEVMGGGMIVYSIKFGTKNCHDEATYLYLQEITLLICQAIIGHRGLEINQTKPLEEFTVLLRSCPARSFPDPKTGRGCISCYGPWEWETYPPDGIDWFNTLAPLHFDPFRFKVFQHMTFGTCHDCLQGIRVRTREPVHQDEHWNCRNLKTETLNSTCTYPCAKDQPAVENITYITNELVVPVGSMDNEISHPFVTMLVNIMYPGISIADPEPIEIHNANLFLKDSRDIRFNLTGCTNPKDYEEIVLATRIICAAIISVDKEHFQHRQAAPDDYTHIILHTNIEYDYTKIAIVAYSSGGLLLLPLFCLLAYFVGYFIFSLVRLQFSDLNHLPEEMAWSYLDYLAKPWNWEKQGSNRAWFHFRDFHPSSPEWRRVTRFMIDYLDGGNIKIESIKAIYNENLLHAFLGAWNTRDSRRGRRMFTMNFDYDADRKFVFDCFRKRVSKMSWNSGNDGNWIVPVVHGTSVANAMSICQRGFAALGKTDEGWYGAGIYFTTYAMYTVPYLQPQHEPALIISWVLPGHFFPVIETTLLGAAIKGGSSHYVVTGYGGKPSTIPIFDEIVIANEFSIAPAFILTLSRETTKVLYQQYHKEQKEYEKYEIVFEQVKKPKKTKKTKEPKLKEEQQKEQPQSEAELPNRFQAADRKPATLPSSEQELAQLAQFIVLRDDESSDSSDQPLLRDGTQ